MADEIAFIHNDWGIIMSVLAGVVWLLRLEGRIASHERVCAELQRQAQEARGITQASLRRIEDRLESLGDRMHPQGEHPH